MPTSSAVTCSAGTHHQLARAHAVAGRAAVALGLLESAIQRGLRGRHILELDAAFERVRDTPAFATLRERL
ncbi:MAG TPA: hypothetical protein VMK65_07495 [Longimicrobiales bacterium]|nr:hypothetical protein [Longimicrobiales bacterium]